MIVFHVVDFVGGRNDILLVVLSALCWAARAFHVTGRQRWRRESCTPRARRLGQLVPWTSRSPRHACGDVRCLGWCRHGSPPPMFVPPLLQHSPRDLPTCMERRGSCFCSSSSAKMLGGSTKHACVPPSREAQPSRYSLGDCRLLWRHTKHCCCVSQPTSRRH